MVRAPPSPCKVSRNLITDFTLGPSLDCFKFTMGPRWPHLQGYMYLGSSVVTLISPWPQVLIGSNVPGTLVAPDKEGCLGGGVVIDTAPKPSPSLAPSSPSLWWFVWEEVALRIEPYFPLHRPLLVKNRTLGPQLTVFPLVHQCLSTKSALRARIMLH